MIAQLHSMTLWRNVINLVGRGSAGLAMAYLLMSGAVFAQESANDIRDALKTRQNEDLVLALGKKGIHSDIPLLQGVAREALKSKNDQLYRGTSLALARLGDEVAFLNVAAGVYSNDGNKAMNGFDALRYIEGAPALRVLLDRLDDDVPPPREFDLLFSSPRDLALVTLSAIVSDSPVMVDGRFLTFKRTSIPGAVGLWRTYFKAHPDFLKDPLTSDWPGALTKLVNTGDESAILVLGRIANDSIIPSLRRYSAADGLSATVASAIQSVLARFGDSASYQAVSKDVRSPDPYVQDSAIEKLTYIGGERGIRSLAGLLGSTAPRRGVLTVTKNGKAVKIEQDLEPLNSRAAKGLRHLIPGFPVRAPVEEQQNRIAEWLKEHRL